MADARIAWKLGAALVVAGVVAWASATPRPPRGALLDTVLARGELVVGVRQYARPAPPRAPTPPEPDHFDTAMARYLAEQLRVNVRVVGLPGDPGTPAWQAAAQQVDLVIAGAGASARTRTTVPTGYVDGDGALVVLRGSAYRHADDLRDRAVCVGQGSPYKASLTRQYRAQPRVYPSAIRAAASFMAGECQALADDAMVLSRLTGLQEWRFYRRLDARLQPDDHDTQIALRVADADAESTAWLDRAVRRWKSDGGLQKAREQRAGDVAFEASQLQDGLVCHS